MLSRWSLSPGCGRSIHFARVEVLMVVASSPNIAITSRVRTRWSGVVSCCLMLSYHWCCSQSTEILLFHIVFLYLLSSLNLHYCGVRFFEIFDQTTFVIYLNRSCLLWTFPTALWYCFRINPNLCNLCV